MMSYVIKGGFAGHAARRLIHMAMLITPFVYYYWLTLPWVLVGALVIVAIFEIIRMHFGWVLFAQREHEAQHISSFAWTIFSLVMVLLFSPSASFSMPIIACCALIDPLVGEMRARSIAPMIVFTTGFFIAMLIWFICAWIYALPFWLMGLMSPVVIAAEWPSFRWIDDNA